MVVRLRWWSCRLTVASKSFTFYRSHVCHQRFSMSWLLASIIDDTTSPVDEICPVGDRWRQGHRSGQWGTNAVQDHCDGLHSHGHHGCFPHSGRKWQPRQHDVGRSLCFCCLWVMRSSLHISSCRCLSAFFPVLCFLAFQAHLQFLGWELSTSQRRSFVKCAIIICVDNFATDNALTLSELWQSNAAWLIMP